MLSQGLASSLEQLLCFLFCNCRHHCCSVSNNSEFWSWERLKCIHGVLFVLRIRNTAQQFPSDRHADIYLMLLWEMHVSHTFFKDQIRSVAQSCLTLCDPMNRNTPGLPVHHQLLEFTQTHVHRVSDAIHPSHPLSSPSPPAPNPSQHQSLFQWVNSSHEVAKVLEFQL